VAIDGPPGADGTGPGRPRSRRYRTFVPLATAVVLVAALAFWSSDQAGKYYIYQPGSAPHLTTSPSCRIDSSGDLKLTTGTPCARLLVPAGKAHDLTGNILMVDVLVGKATPVQFLLHKLGLLNHFSRGSQLIPAVEVLGTTPASQLDCQDDQEMVGATATAPIVALQRLGYKVGAVNHGARVSEVVPGYPAAAAGLKCNDLITAIDGKAVRTGPDADAAITAHPPGSSVSITVQRTGATGKTVTVVLHATLQGRPALDGEPALPKQSFLGIVTATDTTYTLPFDVSVDVGDIGGPSAGLALTLGLLDVLSNGNLTGGHTVAVTGTIDANGDVGDVGGVAQKTVAVERAGAQLFLVPPQEYAAAQSEANGKMKIESVSSLTEALADLKAIGGQIPPPPAPA
jgi:PDZ domain-containing protein